MGRMSALLRVVSVVELERDSIDVSLAVDVFQRGFCEDFGWWLFGISEDIPALSGGMLSERRRADDLDSCYFRKVWIVVRLCGLGRR